MTAAEGGGAVKLAYVVPDFANPTGETLSTAAREGLLDLARQLDIPIVEDAAYSALNFEGEPQALDPGPGCGTLRQHRSGTHNLLRHILQDALSRFAGRLDRRTARLDPPARARQAGLRPQQCHPQSDGDASLGRDRLRPAGRRGPRALSTAARSFARGASAPYAERLRWSGPKGGLFVWLRLPNGRDSAVLLGRAVDEAGVAFVPGAAFYFDRSGHDYLRLSYSLSTEAEIDTGIARLAALI